MVAKKATKTSFAQFRACCAQFVLTLSHWQNCVKRIKRWLSGLIRWIGHICCKKICRKFIHIVSCIRCTVCSDVFTLAKSRETHQKMAFRSNKMDLACLLHKNLQKVRSHSFVHPVHNSDQVRTCHFYISEIAQNASKHEF